MRSYKVDWNSGEVLSPEEFSAIDEPIVPLFAYGTLMTGEGNHRFLTGCQKLSDALLPGYRMLTNGGPPMIVPGPGMICGEVWLVDSSTLARIDCLEGADHPGGAYRRVYLPVQIILGGDVLCEVYVYNRRPQGLRPIPSGDWRDYSRQVTVLYANEDLGSEWEILLDRDYASL